MPAATYAENMALQYLLQGATASRATAWTVGLSVSSVPTDAVPEELADASYTRQAVVFTSSAVSAYKNNAAISFGSMQTATMLRGFLLFDQGGHLLLYGALASNSTVRGGGTDSASFAAGAITVTLA